MIVPSVKEEWGRMARIALFVAAMARGVTFFRQTKSSLVQAASCRINLSGSRAGHRTRIGKKIFAGVK